MNLCYLKINIYYFVEHFEKFVQRSAVGAASVTLTAARFSPREGVSMCVVVCISFIMWSGSRIGVTSTRLLVPSCHFLLCFGVTVSALNAFL